MTTRGAELAQKLLEIYKKMESQKKIDEKYDREEYDRIVRIIENEWIIVDKMATIIYPYICDNVIKRLEKDGFIISYNPNNQTLRHGYIITLKPL